MDSSSPKQTDSNRSHTDAAIPLKERVITLVLIGAVLLYGLWTFRRAESARDRPVEPGKELMATLSAERIPLTTGDEPIEEIFTRAGCPVCHMIPGIHGANGQVGPKLVLGTTGKQRIHRSDYRGQAQTVHDYIVESVLDPERFVVPGYPPLTMPAWYGSKLSALALEKIATYLEQQTEPAPPG